MSVLFPFFQDLTPSVTLEPTPSSAVKRILNKVQAKHPSVRPFVKFEQTIMFAFLFVCDDSRSVKKYRWSLALKPAFCYLLIYLFIPTY